jgi:tetratricopeptide (TPR) repeat protein
LSYPKTDIQKGQSATGVCTNQNDVFDEMTPILLAQENCRAKILFPYHKTDNHWLVGELVVDKKGKTVSVVALAHDARGDGVLSSKEFKILENRLKEVFEQYDVEVNSKLSQFTSKRLSIGDVSSSGVIVANELIKRITGESLTLSEAYPVGARQLRERQIMFLLEICDDDDDEVQSCIDNIALKDDENVGSQEAVLCMSIDEIRMKVREIATSEAAVESKIEELQKIELDYYKPLVRQLAHKNSFEELKDLLLVFNDLIVLTLALGEFTDRLDYLTEAAIICQYLKTVFKEKFPSTERRDKILERHSINPSQRWNEIQEKIVAKIGGKLDLLSIMTADEEEYRKNVKNMRRKIKKKVKLIDQRFEKLKATKPHDMDEHRNTIVQPIRNMFEHIAVKMTTFLAKLFSDSEKIMATPPPCQYAIIGLGSLALQQITPYSDFEFAILTELDAHVLPDVMKYFKNLSHLANFKTIGLGETSIPNSKFAVDLKHLVHVGINFDLGGKTPLGRADKFYSLIKNVPEMLRYVYNKDDKTTHIDKCLSYILENVCYVAGEKSLFEKFHTEVSNFLKQANAEGQKNCEVRAMKILEEGAVEFDYVNQQPDQDPKKKNFEGDVDKLREKFTTNEGKSFNVKLECYRLSERMVYNLGLYFGIEGKSCWDTIDKLKDKGIINNSAHKNLQYAVSFANLLRLKTYIKSGAQTGVMSVYPKDSDTSESSTMLELTKEELEEDGEFFNYFYRAYPLYEKLEKFCSEYVKLTGAEKRNYFHEESFFERDSTTTGLIYVRFNQNENSLRHLEAGLPDLDNETKMRILGVIANAYNRKGDFDKGLQCYKQSLEMKKTFYNNVDHESVAATLNNIGVNYCFKTEYDLALEYLEKSLQMRRNVFKDVAHPEITTALKNIGSAYSSKGEYDLALKHYEECFKMLKIIHGNVPQSDIVNCLAGIGNVYHEKCDYDLALQYHKERLEMSNTFYNDMPLLASSLNEIGSVYVSKGEHDLALHYFENSLAMKKMIFKNVAHQEVAGSLNNIGVIYYVKGEYDLSLQYHQECLEMRKIVFKDTPHPSVASSFYNIGCIYEHTGDYNEALNFYKKGLEMQKTLFKDVANADVANSLTTIGGVYHRTGDYDSALQYYVDSLEMRKAVFKDVAHPCVASSFKNVGSIYHLTFKWSLALQYYEESLKMYKTFFKDAAHKSVATLLKNIGEVYKIIGEHNIGDQYIRESSDMQNLLR